jgi:tRNA wybutosine-synthesizing protein 2
MQYREYLKMSLEGMIPGDLPLPRGYHLVGHVSLLTLNFQNDEYSRLIGEATLRYDSRVKSVAVRKGPTSGIMRRPEYILVAGSLNTDAMHNENGVLFRVDPLKLTFSGGNKSERIHLAEKVDSQEYVVDMFACVGQFTLHVARNSGARVVAIEINPEAFWYLQKNIHINGLDNRVEARLGDCRIVHPLGVADRVIMGYLHNTIDFLPDGIETLSPQGGIIHLHSAISKEDIESYCNTINTISGQYGFHSDIVTRRVKQYAPGIVHYVFDISFRPE